MSQLKHPVVMLSSTKASNIKLHLKDIYTKHQLIYHKEGYYHTASNLQHLYILSDDKIEEGDWFYADEYAPVEQAKDFEGVFMNGFIKANCKKVIASTDKSLGVIKYTEGGYVINGGQPVLLPNLSIGFIEKYIKMYNLATPITDVIVEYEECTAFYDKHTQLSLRADNTITIHPVEIKTYTEDQVKVLMVEMLHDYINDNTSMGMHSTRHNQVNQWWKERVTNK